ncbi:MAG: hypothetical protein ABEJ79_08575 [Halolamina sp.]
MLGTNVTGRVLAALKSWSPAPPAETSTADDRRLRRHLDRELSGRRNVLASALGLGGGHVVRAGGPGTTPAAVVDDSVGVEVVWDATDAELRTLADRLRRYDGEYDDVAVCACGVEAVDRWKRVRFNFEGGRGDVGDGTRYHFLAKRRADEGAAVVDDDDLG